MSEPIREPSLPPATPCAHGGPVGEAVLRAEPADFQVDEIMTVEPEG